GGGPGRRGGGGGAGGASASMGAPSTRPAEACARPVTIAATRSPASEPRARKRASARPGRGDSTSSIPTGAGAPSVATEFFMPFGRAGRAERFRRGGKNPPRRQESDRADVRGHPVAHRRVGQPADRRLEIVDE